MTYNFIPILHGILESERDSPNEVRSENEDGKIWVSALAKTLWTVCVYNRRDILLAVTNVGASFALRRVATARVPSEWHSQPGEQRLIKSTTLKTFCLRFSRFSQYSRISIPIPSLTLSLSVCLSVCDFSFRRFDGHWFPMNWRWCTTAGLTGWS